MRTCKDCKFFEIAAKAKGKAFPGWCHRLPPVPVKYPEMALTFEFPQVFSNDWCGVSEAKPAKDGTHGKL